MFTKHLNQQDIIFKPVLYEFCFNKIWNLTEK